MKRAFTLVELLVVVAIIVVLLALLVPALDRAIDRAERVVCASQLHAIGVGATTYAIQNKQALFICRFRQVQISFNLLGSGGDNQLLNPYAVYARPGDLAVDWPAALATVGLAGAEKSLQDNGVIMNTPSKAWDCPSRKYKSYCDGGQLVVSYQYFGGIETWTNFWDPSMPARSPVRLSRSRGDWALAADFTFLFNQTWGNDYNTPQYYRDPQAHKRGDSPAPAGHNQAYMDGSAEWLDADRLIAIHNWIPADPNHLAFWYQKDLGGWDPPEAAYLKDYK